MGDAHHIIRWILIARLALKGVSDSYRLECQKKVGRTYRTNLSFAREASQKKKTKTYSEHCPNKAAVRVASAGQQLVQRKVFHPFYTTLYGRTLMNTIRPFNRVAIDILPSSNDQRSQDREIISFSRFFFSPPFYTRLYSGVRPQRYAYVYASKSIHTVCVCVEVKNLFFLTYLLFLLPGAFGSPRLKLLPQVLQYHWFCGSTTE